MFSFFVWYFPVIKKLPALCLVCRIIKVSFRLWVTRQLWEHNIRAVLKISVQWSASRVQRPESSVQSPASRVQRSESRVQRPESSVQLLRPEPRNSGMPSCQRALNFDQWKIFSEDYKSMRVRFWLGYKFTENFCHSWLFFEFNQIQKEMFYLSWQNTYPNLKTTCHAK